MNTRLIGQIDFNITDLCNRTCAFCPRGNAEIYPNNNENMSLELFDQAMQQIDDERFNGTVMLAGRGEKVAFHWEGEPGDTRTLTYSDMLEEVSKFANVIFEFG